MKNKLLLRVCLLCSLSISVMAQSPQSLSPQELEVYNMHKIEIDAYVKISTDDKLEEMYSKYIVPFKYQVAIKDLVEKQALRVSICYYMFSENTTMLNKTNRAIHKEYDPSITRNLLLAGANVTTENYSLAIRIKEKLSLNDTQIDSIVNKSIEINRLLVQQPHMDVWAHELKTFNKVFSSTQMDLFLNYKNDRIIKRDIKNAWNLLRDNNMTTDLDSVKVANELYTHYFRERKAADLYYKNDSLKKEVLKAINENNPLSIERLNAIKKGKQTQQSYKGNYIW